MPDISLSENFLLAGAALSILPLLLISSTSFIKLAIVFSLVRNALGVQQIPPNMVIYSLSLILTFFIMAPILHQSWLIASPYVGSGESFLNYLPQALQPLSDFLKGNISHEHLVFFEDIVDKLWENEHLIVPEVKDYLILLPTFMITEISEAFQIGFLIYLPFLAIDIVISNILLALGMMMVSPVTISLPFKLFLFVTTDGWSRLIRGLILSYQ